MAQVQAASHGFTRGNLYMLKGSEGKGQGVARKKNTTRAQDAKMKGYEGDACFECGNFTLIRNGTCLKCDTCGASSGCS